jgi:hypothetical protein
MERAAALSPMALMLICMFATVIQRGAGKPVFFACAADQGVTGPCEEWEGWQNWHWRWW